MTVDEPTTLESTLVTLARWAPTIMVGVATSAAEAPDTAAPRIHEVQPPAAEPPVAKVASLTERRRLEGVRSRTHRLETAAFGVPITMPLNLLCLLFNTLYVVLDCLSGGWLAPLTNLGAQVLTSRIPLLTTPYHKRVRGT